MNLVKNNFSTTFITKTWDSSINRNNYLWNYSKGNTKNITEIKGKLCQTKNNPRKKNPY